MIYTFNDSQCSSNSNCTFPTPVCDDISGACVGCTDAYCESSLGPEYSCEYSAITQSRYCSNETSSFCESSEDCQDIDEFGFGLDYECEDITMPVNISNTWIDVTVPVCLPQGNCAEDEDCFAGSECMEFNFEDIFTFHICNLGNNTCTQDSDCENKSRR